MRHNGGAADGAGEELVHTLDQRVDILARCAGRVQEHARYVLTEQVLHKAAVLQQHKHE